MPFLIPSCAISSVSIATSFLVALKVGPVHFVGQPSAKFHQAFSLPVSWHSDRAVLALDGSRS
jgi:hypothetical protein